MLDASLLYDDTYKLGPALSSTFKIADGAFLGMIYIHVNGFFSFSQNLLSSALYESPPLIIPIKVQAPNYPGIFNRGTLAFSYPALTWTPARWPFDRPICF